jgi:rod shape-determining protein MreD
VRNWVFLLILVIVVLVQATLLNYVRIFGVKPDLLILLVVVAAAYLNWRSVVLLSFIAGLFKDIFGSAGFGINIFLLPLLGYLVWKVSRQISIDDPIGLSAVAFLAVLLNDIASRPFYFYSGRDISLGIFMRITVIEALYTALTLQAIVKGLEYGKKIFYRYRLSKNAINKAESK